MIKWLYQKSYRKFKKSCYKEKMGDYIQLDTFTK